MTSEERHKLRYQRRVAKRREKLNEYKKEYDDFDNVASPRALFRAEKCSRKGVRKKSSVINYNINLDRNIYRTSRKLYRGEDIRAGFIEFDLKERGKSRHIKSVHYSERIVQRSVCDNALIPVLKRSLVYDNGASLKGKGIKFTIDRVTHHLREYYRKYGTNEGWILLTDFKGYFDSIEHEPLRCIIDKHFDDERLKTLIWSFVEAFGDSSLGIGSQVSQILALSYANRFDHYIKEVGHIGLSSRYNDDGYAISNNKEDLIKLLEGLRIICKDLGITMSPKKTQIVPLKYFRFMKVGFVLTDTGKVIKKANPDSFKRMRKRIPKQKRLVDSGQITLSDAKNSFESSYGYLKHYDCHERLVRSDRLFYGTFHVRIKHKRLKHKRIKRR